MALCNVENSIHVCVGKKITINKWGVLECLCVGFKGRGGGGGGETERKRERTIEK